MTYPEEGTTAFAFETVTVDNTVGGVRLTVATHSPSNAQAASRALITVETAEIRYQYHASAAPTSTVGHLAQPGDPIVLEGLVNITNFRAIRTTGSNAPLSVTYER